MALRTRYVHTNLIAHDWRKLAAFYIQVMGCIPVLPERDLSGDWLERSTGVRGAAIQGIHLRLPGHGDHGPTLEVFQYNVAAHGSEPVPNRPGFAHIAFSVDDLQAACVAVLGAGGRAVGEIVSTGIPGVGTISFAYVTDPEGNIIELQHWD